jgi:hypothetical protein
VSEDDGVLHLFEAQVQVTVKIWGWDKEDADRLLLSSRHWDDWWIDKTIKIVDTGKTA